MPRPRLRKRCSCLWRTVTCWLMQSLLPWISVHFGMPFLYGTRLWHMQAASNLLADEMGLARAMQLSRQLGGCANPRKLQTTDAPRRSVFPLLLSS